MRVVSCGFTTHIVARPLLFQPVTFQHPGLVIQCPGLTIQCPGVTLQCQGVTLQCPKIVIKQCIKVTKMAPETALPLALPLVPVMCACAPPLDNVSNSASGNHSLSSRVNNCPPVPRNNETDRQTDIRKNVSPRPKKKRINFKRRERRARERREEDEAFNHDARRAGQSAGAPSSPSVPDQLTPLGLPHSDPISAMRPAVYPPVTLEGRPSANDNSPFQFDQELGESAGLLPGLYKPAVPDPQHHTWAYTSAATSAKPGPPSPSRNLAASSAGDRSRTGIVYPLQPRSQRLDVYIEVESTLPEPAALLRPDLQQQPTREAPTSLSRPSRRHCRKRRRNRSTALYRPAKRSPPRGHWCEI